MEDKVNYAFVGAFVIALSAALIAGVLWLAAGANGHKRYDTYQSIVRESVAGLNLDAPVKYLGVDVGKVSEIIIDPENSRQVRLHFRIERGTPIRRDAEAVLKTQGLTGIVYVELSGGSANSPLLTVDTDGEIPMIKSIPSLSKRLESVLTTLLASLDSTSNNLNSVFDADNRAALKSTLADTAILMRALASQDQVLRTGIADAARTASNAASASVKIEPTIDRISAAADTIDTMGKAATVASVNAGRSVDAAAAGIQQISMDTVPAIEHLVEELTALARSLRTLSEQTERAPNSLLFGAPKPRPGPGEESP